MGSAHKDNNTKFYHKDLTGLRKELSPGLILHFKKDFDKFFGLRTPY
mgnify:FL=1